MSIVKLTKKEELDRLIAQITFRLGKRPTQQDILDKCVELGEAHIEELIEKLSDYPIIDDQKISEIIKMRTALKIIPRSKVSPSHILSTDDLDLYSN